MPHKPKVVQIVSHTEQTNKEAKSYLVALCEDGSMWKQTAINGEWLRMPTPVMENVDYDEAEQTWTIRV